MDIFERIKELNLPKGEYMICGSAILAVLGIREAKDIDILVSPKLFEELENKHGWFRHPKYNDSLEHPEHIAGAKANLDFMKENYTLDEALSQAEVINDIPFMNLQVLVEAKKQLGREKDLKDIELIEKFLKERVEKGEKKVIKKK